jgi:hypothetical protein
MVKMGLGNGNNDGSRYTFMLVNKNPGFELVSNEAINFNY